MIGRRTIETQSEVNECGGADRARRPPKFEMRPPGVLKPNPRNARKRTKREVQRIADSIKSAGNLQPIVVDENDVILAGHGRLAAAKLLGLEMVPTIKAVGLTDAQKRVFAIACNRLTENSNWDREVLATEFAELAELLEGEGLELAATGFDPAEIDAILHDFSSDFPEADDTVPRLQAKAVSRRGDLWLLGPHRLMCGDTRSAADVGRLMAGAKARMAFADAPYNLKIASFQGRGRTKHREFLVASGEQTRDEFIAFLKETAANIAAVCVDGAIVFMCMDWRHMGEMLAAGEAVFRAQEPHRLEQDLARAGLVLPQPARADLRLKGRQRASSQCFRPWRPWAHARERLDLPRHEHLQVRAPTRSGPTSDRQARRARRRRAARLLDEGRYRCRSLHGIGHHHHGRREGRSACLRHGN
jgi:ParB-like chromosome segregation protein Spo0J